MKTRVKMVDSQDPEEIPNGTLGWANDRMDTHGLKYVEFDNGHWGLVYKNEITEEKETN